MDYRIIMISIIIIYSLIGICYIGYSFIKYILKIKEDKKKLNINEAIISEEPIMITLSQIRNQKFPENISNHVFFIDKSLSEAFNIFMSIAPDLIQTLIKANKRISSIENKLLSNADLLSDEIYTELLNIDNILITLEETSDIMIEKIESVSATTGSPLELKEINSELIKTYMNLVNMSVSTKINYTNTEYETGKILKERYSDSVIVETYHDIIEKISYIAFTNIIKYDDMFDNHIYLYK